MAIGRGRGRSQDHPDTAEQQARRRQYQEIQQQGHRTEFRSTAELNAGDVLAWPDSTAVTVLEKKPGNKPGTTILKLNLPADDTGEFDDGERCWLTFIGVKADVAAAPRDRRPERPVRGRRR